MVCLSDEGTISATVRDMCKTSTNGKKTHFLQLYPEKPVDAVFNEITHDYGYDAEDIELTLRNNRTSENIILNQHREKTLKDAGVSFEPSSRTTIIITQAKAKNMALYVQSAAYEDDLLLGDLLGASASPTTGEAPPSDRQRPAMSITDFYSSSRGHSSKDTCNYVGLVNQAMTCYLNSLLQALYMTPEFRNALYNWEFDGSNPGNSIPFQLQRLFLNLQTSAKSSVETTDLTHSFGWNMQQAWEQHDIQELCRVMFDALEQKFKDTKQANLINDLYEGKMLDYVKCLECSTEKSREDTFLDIPLPVRPFGSAVAYNSVEEALRAFVQPETLDGNNQYHCEKCNKKCDAHKGLKFTKFPYLLTLHLKRFDFDYSTMNRIKLNDKVVFPEKLNLNSFISGANLMGEDLVYDRETVVKNDDCSTTDSGSALDDESCQCTDVTSSVNGPDDNCQDDDEGIDVSSGNNHHENEKNRLQEPKGPYIYELFSIMIHSGSASGGHYYAYIKDFSKNQWFCFNDQSVNKVTEDDIHKTYGGGPQRYYSGAYTSSTNAYMLMYRQIDKERNCEAYTVDEFPAHIKTLLTDMRNKEESDRLKKEKETDTFKIKIYCQHPKSHQMLEEKMFAFVETPLREALSDAYDAFKLKDVVRFEDCRLVAYNKLNDAIEFSFQNENVLFGTIANSFSEFLLEIKNPDMTFDDYKIGGVNMKVYLIDLETEEVDGPSSIWVNTGDTVHELKIRLAKLFKLETVHVVQETYSNQPHYLDQEDTAVRFDPKCNGYKLYVSKNLDLDDPEKPFVVSKLASVIERFVHIIMLDIALPDTDIGTLEQLSIPCLEQNLDRIEVGAGDKASPSSLRVSPQPGAGSCELFGDQSNSEDSSLSDSDRTLVGDAPGDNLGLLSSSSNSPADQHMASPTEIADTSRLIAFYDTCKPPQEEMHWDDDETAAATERSSPFFYFKAQIPKQGETTESKTCRVLVDKRMNLGKLKKNLEAIVGVPTEYFKVYRQYPNQDMEWSSLTDTLSSIKDGQRINIKLGRVLKPYEMSCKIFYLNPNASEPVTFWFEWIIAKEQTVESVKREILIQAKKQYMIDIPFNRCRLRKKNIKNPYKIYLDHQKFCDDIAISNNYEFFVQEAEPKEENQLILFVKRWYPSTLSLSPFTEITLNNRTMDEFKKVVSSLSEIPLDHLEVACVKYAFPGDMNILDVHSKLDWTVDVDLLENFPLQVFEDGSIFYYRDKTEELKELTREEKRQLNEAENKRLGRFSAKTYSPRRERGLKIYVDTSPKKEEEVFLD